MRPRKRHGVPIRTPALPTRAPPRRRKPQPPDVLRLAVPSGRGRRDRSGGAGSGPAVRGTAAGSGPCASAHLPPRPLGSLPPSGPCAGRRFGRRFEAAEQAFAVHPSVGAAAILVAHRFAGRAFVVRRERAVHLQSTFEASRNASTSPSNDRRRPGEISLIRGSSLWCEGPVPEAVGSPPPDLDRVRPAGPRLHGLDRVAARDPDRQRLHGIDPFSLSTWSTCFRRSSGSLVASSYSYGRMVRSLCPWSRSGLRPLGPRRFRTGCALSNPTSLEPSGACSVSEALCLARSVAKSCRCTATTYVQAWPIRQVPGLAERLTTRRVTVRSDRGLDILSVRPQWRPDTRRSVPFHRNGCTERRCDSWLRFPRLDGCRLPTGSAWEDYIQAGGSVRPG